jgi:DMSO/TMAO reductase YedYZ molybdopterin-dependent catalytic subunit
MERIRQAATGLLAALAGMSAGHLAASLGEPASSPVLAVGSLVIDLTPTPVKEWAVARFGTADKPLLVASVLIVTLLSAALIGLVAARRLRRAVLLLGVLVTAAGAAVVTRPGAAVADLVPSAITLVVAVGVLVLLTPLPRPRDESGPASRERRVLLGAGLAIAVASVAAAVVGQARTGARAVRDLVLPRPASPAPPLPKGLEATVPGVSPLQTPTDRFYRVDVNLSVPRVEVDSWRLDVDGLVERPLTLTFDMLSGLPLIERDITLTCVSNEVGGGYVSSGRWLGVRVSDLLARAGVRGAPDQVLSTAVDGFTISTPLAALTDGRDAMVAIGLNGSALPDEHGFPARLVTPGLYGFVGATKWLRRLTLTTYAAQDAYWTRRRWATDAPVKTSARIDTPAPLSTIAAGRVVVGGVAWAQQRGIGEVEVRFDGGPWQRAELGPDIGIDCWRQWYLPWDAAPGLHRLAVRATDLLGQGQTAERATPFPNGASGIQEIVVTAA